MKKLNARQIIRDKVLKVCLRRGITLKEFLFEANVPTLRWYNFMNGKIPRFTTVVNLVKSSSKKLKYQDFEAAIEE